MEATITTSTRTPREWSRLIRKARAARSRKECTPWWSVDANNAQSNFTEVMYELAEALFNAPWGQCGSSFITHKKKDRNGNRIKTLWMNSRQVASCNYVDSRVDPQIWAVVLTAKEGERNFKAKKKAQRNADAEYKANLAQCVTDIRYACHYKKTGFGSWKYQPGLEGGVFYKENTDIVVVVSARGAMYAAWGDEDAEEIYWDCESIRMDRQTHGARY